MSTKFKFVVQQQKSQTGQAQARNIYLFGIIACWTSGIPHGYTHIGQRGS